MVRGSLICRLSDIARRHAWDGVAGGAVCRGSGGWRRPGGGGAEKLVEAVTPGIDAPRSWLAQASDDPARAGEGVARLPMFGFRTSRYSPQVLFPVTGHLLPLWMQLRGELDLPPLSGWAAAPPSPSAWTIWARTWPAPTGRWRCRKPVALSFLPYAEATPFLAEEAERKGHDVLAHVPMEALSATDPGPMVLKAGRPTSCRSLNWNLDRVPGLSGINNHEGSRFSEDEPRWSRWSRRWRRGICSFSIPAPSRDRG